MINARRKLEVDVQNLEAKRKLVEVAQASSDYVFDDSQLARAKELINDIRTRLDVAAKLANADVNVANGNPVERSRPGRHHRPGDPILQARRQGSERHQSVRREEAGSSRRELLARRNEVATHQLRIADLGLRIDATLESATAICF